MKHYFLDMDGVLVHGRNPIPGAAEFLGRLREANAEYLVLTNNPMYTARDLSHRLKHAGLDIPPERIFTSAMATARFMHSQKPGGTAFIIGETGLTQPLYDAGFVATDISPDYVVLGETFTYHFEHITKAIRLVAGGALFIATNPDPSGPSESGLVPACGAMAALIQTASGKEPLFVGKPNPLMMRMALNHLGVHSEDSVMVGDRMSTDIIAGLQTGMETVLVLSGVTREEDIANFPFKPTRVVNAVNDIDLGE